MTARNINQDYFAWLISLIGDGLQTKPFNKLLNYLYDQEFVYILPMDGNRYSDGINLRYRYGYDYGIEDPIIASCLDNKSCSILEMMVALCVRVEEHIMQNPENGLAPGRWFWGMIDNLGLATMTDDRYDIEYVNGVIWRFLNREYGPDGKGGPIYIPNCPYDLRTMEIWYQMMRYLSEYKINEGE